VRPLPYRYLIALAAALLVGAAPAFAGTVTGTVISQTGTGLPGARVESRYLWTPPGGTPRWAVYNSVLTDSRGAFRLESQPDCVLAVSRTGYVSEFWNNRYAAHTADRLGAGSGASIALYPGSATPRKTVRVAGANRYAGSVAIARSAYPGWTGIKHVVLACGEDKAAADPLSAAGLSWAYVRAPVLLTASGSTDASVETALSEIVAANGVVTVHIVGGTSSVPEARKTEIVRALGSRGSSLRFDRVTGANRYEVAAAVAARMKAARGVAMPGVALIANGADPATFYDALALSAISARKGAPVLLVERDSVPGATRSALSALGRPQVYVAGGTSSVTPAVVSSLGSRETSRMAGATRYATARAVADMALARGWLTAMRPGLAATLPDALTGGAAVGYGGSPLLLTPGPRLGPDAHVWLNQRRTAVGGLRLFGGEASVRSDVASDADVALTR